MIYILTYVINTSRVLLIIICYEINYNLQVKQLNFIIKTKSTPVFKCKIPPLINILQIITITTTGVASAIIRDGELRLRIRN